MIILASYGYSWHYCALQSLRIVLKDDDYFGNWTDKILGVAEVPLQQVSAGLGLAVYGRGPGARFLGFSSLSPCSKARPRRHLTDLVYLLFFFLLQPGSGAG